MKAIHWISGIVVVLFGVLIMNGWQHDHYPFAFVAIIAVGLLAAYVHGLTDDW